ncbi:hypothetical protein PsYK624_057980 [Phanerochaete sordida]|uniref:Uncharacterized protein n=1 Tax=Phanerochaete sordida TaxID=48140 RepID=A0A9P3G5P2_9APHY|nr:hypothetical protein PsYK624_057980 [Phanerochaete sordida]
MTKSKDDVVREFNLLTNMSVDELQQWLDDPKSKNAGTGVGIESGHKIVEILKKNPDKDPEKYDDEDIEHMRKVVSYDKRHMAQEDHLKETKTKEELGNTKSTISLKNWGHDPIKSLDEEGTDKPANGTSEKETTSTDAPAEEKSEKPSEASTGSKRKIAESAASDKDAKEAQEKAKQDEIEALAKDAGVDFEDPGAAGSEAVVEEEAEEEQRARKKSKTGTAEQDETVDG